MQCYIFLFCSLIAVCMMYSSVFNIYVKQKETMGRLIVSYF